MCCYTCNCGWMRYCLKRIYKLPWDDPGWIATWNVPEDCLTRERKNHALFFIKKMICIAWIPMDVPLWLDSFSISHTTIWLDVPIWLNARKTLPAAISLYGLVLPLRPNLFVQSWPLLDYICSGLLESKPHHQPKQNKRRNFELPLGLGQSSAISLMFPRQFDLVQVHV